MKQLRKHLIYLILISAILQLIGCPAWAGSKELTRSKAKNILEKNLNRTDSIAPDATYPSGDRRIEKLYKLRDAGYITLSETHDYYGAPVINLSPTEKLKPFIVRTEINGVQTYDFRVANLDVRVTGITKMSEQSCIVEFDAKPVLNSLGKLLNGEDQTASYTMYITHETLEFRLYDDGWRVINPYPNN